MNPFGDAPVESAPSPTVNQPSGANPFGDHPVEAAQPAGANPFGDHPVAMSPDQKFNNDPNVKSGADDYVRQKWEGFGKIAQQSEGQGIRDYAQRVFGDQAKDSAVPALRHLPEQNIHAAVGYVQSTVPPQRQQELEQQWRQEYAANALPNAVNQQQQAAGAQDAAQHQTTVGRVHGMVDAPVRGALKAITEPVSAGTQAWYALGSHTDNSGLHGAAGAQTDNEIREQASMGVMNHVNQYIDNALPRSTAAQNGGRIQGAIESGLEMLPQLALTGKAFNAGGLQKALALSQFGAQNFDASYKQVYAAAKSQGLNDNDATNAALGGGLVDAAVNTYLMKFGAVGQAVTAQPMFRRVLTMAAKDALAQGSVGGAQGLVGEATKFVATGEAPQFQNILDQAFNNAVAGAGFGVHRGLTEAPAPDQQKPTQAAPVPVPDAATMKTLVEQPSPTPILDKAQPKYRNHDKAAGESFAGPINFENADDKAAYIATHPRAGKATEEAGSYLKGKGYSDQDIQDHGQYVRQQVEAQVKPLRGEAAEVRTIGRPQADTSGSPAAGNEEVRGPVQAPGTGERGVNNIDTTAAIQAAQEKLPGVKPANPANKSQADFARQIEDIAGRKVQFVEGAGGSFVMKEHPDVVFVDKDATGADLAEAVVHELHHKLQDESPELAAQLEKTFTPEQHTAAAERYAQRAEFAGKKDLAEQIRTDPALRQRETGALLIGEAVRNPKVLEGLGVDTRSTLRKVVDKMLGYVGLGKLSKQQRAIHDGLSKVRDALGGTNEKVEATAEAGKVRDQVPPVRPNENLGAVAGESAGKQSVPTVAAAGRQVDAVKRRVREADAKQGMLFLPKHSDRVRDEAREYTEAHGIPYHPDHTYAEVNTDRAKQIAAEYDAAKHNPNDPAVKASYDAMKKETLDQYNYLQKKGVKLEAWQGEGQPYKDSAEMRQDVTDNKHLYFFTGGELPADHPLAERAPGTPYTYNDVFRAVHDYFGHAKEGVGFGPRGEENAWRSHSQLYSEEARPAMTTETRGQNSWVNFGPHGEANQANPENTRYAEQKATLLNPEHGKVQREDGTSFLPKNDEERERAVSLLSKKLGVEPADAHAIIWHYEQQLKGDHEGNNAAGSTGQERAAEGQDAGHADVHSTDAAGEGGANFLPGGKAVKQFTEEDVKPAIADIGERARQLWDGVKSLIAPQTRSEDAGKSARTIREMGADRAQRMDRLDAAFKDTKEYFDKLPQAETRAFIDQMEHGPQVSNPALQPVADALRAVLDDRLHQVQALGTGKLQQFVMDYFPHLWKDPKKAGVVYRELLGKTPMEGSKKFLKARTLQFFSDGISRGLEPVTENPVEAVMMRAREMDKYITAQRAFLELKGQGLMKQVAARKVNEAQKQGYEKINDNIATIFAAPNRRGGISTAGYWMAPEGVATVINNHLSPGLRNSEKFGPAFRAYLGAGNAMNQVQLGLSGFHLLMTTLDSATSKLGLSAKQLASGQYAEAGKSALSAASVIGPAIGNVKNGNLILREWMKPGSTTPDIAQVVDAMKAAGGRVKMDDFYHTGMVDKMMTAFRQGNVLGGVLRAPMAAMEAAGKPLMEKLVPRMKMGVFMDMAKFELQKLGPSASRDEVRQAMGKAWDSVDNRMGELVYDNLFWHKAVKDLAMASTRSVGWNLGTLRELGGGVHDLVSNAVQAGKDRSFKNTEFTHRMAYTAAMPVMAGLVGGLIHTLMNGSPPSQLKDYFFPRTGDKDKDGHDVRLALPSYMKDVLEYGKDARDAGRTGDVTKLGRTLANKTHPLINTVWSMLKNEDYYGHQIRNEKDGLVGKLLDEAKYLGQQLEPFGIREVGKLAGQGQGAKSILPLIGVVQARHDITNSPAENMANDLLKERGLPHAKQAPDAATQRPAKGGRLERTVRHLDVSDAFKVWEEADDGEKKRMGSILASKIRAAKLPADDKIEYMKRFQADWKRITSAPVSEDGE